ncbi:LysR family transcriptional regulator [Tsukamurella tyrosinosolvens]|uniref:LysR family transcriptional regulator n=1 Tax=Tsukamurella tyrosinosolvens TaxID=57704 RepID=UPI003690E092
MIDVLGLRVLVAIAETGSVTAAAAELGYSPSNVTQHLRRLEAKLHTPMVERVGRGIVLTDQAARLVRRGRKLLDELDDLAVETMARPSGRFDVAAFPTAMRGLLIPTVADLVRDEPDLRVQPHELEPAAALDRLRAGRVRAAVVKEWGGRRGTGGRLADHVPTRCRPHRHRAAACASDGEPAFAGARGSRRPVLGTHSRGGAVLS